MSDVKMLLENTENGLKIYFYDLLFDQFTSDVILFSDVCQFLNATNTSINKNLIIIVILAR